MNGGLGVVAGAPGAVGEHVRGEVFDDGVEDDAVAAGGDQRGVGLELGEDVRVGVVGVQADEDALMTLGRYVHCSMIAGALEVLGLSGCGWTWGNDDLFHI